jgi:hypothetical protein
VPTVTAYNEVRGADGRLRAAYRRLEQRLAWDPACPPTVVRQRLAGRPLGDDHSVAPVPLALSEADHRRLYNGVAQRARALQQFYVDSFLGDQTYLRSGTPLTAALLDEMMSVIGTSVDYFRAWWQGHAPDEVRFVYGPDLVRDSGGQWRVIEDNVGCVGGCADSHFVGATYRQAAGDPEPQPAPDMSRAVSLWLDSLGLAPGDPGVIALVSDGDSLDGYLPATFDEAGRRARLLGDLGVAILDDHEFEKVCRRAQDHPDELRAIVNIGVTTGTTWPLLRDVAFGLRRVPMLNAPGTIVLGHKALLPFVDDMIRFYGLGDPLLATPRTILLTDGLLPDDDGDWVVKTATGCRCDGVFVLRWQQPDELDYLRVLLRGSWPANASVAQQYVEPSRLTLNGDHRCTYRVEVRALAYVTGWQQVSVSQQVVATLVADDPPGRLNDVFTGASYGAVISDHAPFPSGRGGDSD